MRFAAADGGGGRRTNRGAMAPPAMSGSALNLDHFASPIDPRRRKVVSPLVGIFISIAEFGREERTWLSQLLDLTRGVPHPTASRYRPSGFCGLCRRGRSKMLP